MQQTSMIPFAQPTSGNVQTMSSVEIADLTGKALPHVHRDIRAMLAALKDDPKVDHPREDKDARGYTLAFHLNRELTDTLLTGYSIPLRRKVVARWRELEQQAQQPPVALPQDYIEALEHLLAAKKSEKLAIEQRDAATSQLAIAAPKVAFVDGYVDASGLKGFREVAKLLKANESRLREFLIDRRVMYRLNGEWMAYQHHIDAGRFEVKTGKSERSGHAFNRCMFTTKGVSWMAGEWAKYQLGGEAA